MISQDDLVSFTWPDLLRAAAEGMGRAIGPRYEIALVGGWILLYVLLPTILLLFFKIG